MGHGADDITFADRASPTTGCKPRSAGKMLARINGRFRQLDLHALDMELMATWQAHDPALPIDVFLQAHNTLYLPAVVLSSERMRPRR
jgi:hypothetical protein